MKKSLLFPLLLIVFVFGAYECQAQSLSQNSNINAADSYIVFDMSMVDQSVVNLAQPVFDPSTGTTTSTLTMGDTKNYRVEAGYNIDGLLTVNVFSLDPDPDPNATGADNFLAFRLAGDKFVIFDRDGNPLPILLPGGATPPNPLEFLGTNPGPSVVDGMVTSDVITLAIDKEFSLVTSDSGGATTAVLDKTLQPSGDSMTMTYLQVGNFWELSSVEISSSSPESTESHVGTITNLGWYSNADADALRASLGSTALAPPSESTVLPDFPVAPAMTVEPGCSASGTGTNVVLQHGIFSGCSTWDRMNPWLQETFEFGEVIRPSLSSTDSLESQGTELFNAMVASGKDNFIIIGHSQGGLIGRDVVQRSKLLIPRLTQGVITVNTPNQGALLAQNGEAALTALMIQAIDNLLIKAGCTTFLDSYECFVAYFAVVGTFGVGVNFADTAIPAIGDLKPGSDYLTQLNGVPETFTRVGVVGNARKRWAPMRLGGDARCNPEQFCIENGIPRGGGRVFVAVSDVVYYVNRICEVIGYIYGYYSQARYCRRVANAMDKIDFYWNLLTTNLIHGSDGIVDTNSQVYPNATANYIVGKADSHVGATQSHRTRVAIEAALEQQFFLTRRNCSYSLSQASALFPIAGGTGSFTVSTTTDCFWSGASDDPWVEVTAGGEPGGNFGDGTVSFQVADNFELDLPRSTTISVGDQTFLVNQEGNSSCELFVSPTSFLIPDTGGTRTVTVATAPGCFWTASVGQIFFGEPDWLNLSGGPIVTGTGSGTVSFWVGPNSDTSGINKFGLLMVAGTTVTVRQESNSDCGSRRVC